MLGLYQGSDSQRVLSNALAKIKRLGGTKRFWEIDKLERYYLGTQHDGKPSWWHDDVPARERQPCIISGLPKAAVEQAVRFTLGEGKFPRFQFTVSEQPRKIGGITLGLSKEEATKLDELWKEVANQCHLKLVAREMLRRGLSMRTACGTYSLRDGELSIEIFNPKHCKAEWVDDRKKELASLECRYIFPKEEQRPDGTTEEVWYWYRRVIDAESDIVYHEVRVEDGEEPVWSRDDSRSVDHATGFCPAFWFPNLPRMDLGDEDGCALVDGLEDEIDAIDYTLSIRHTGAFVYGSPQAWQTGVIQQRGPSADGRTAEVVDVFRTIDGGEVKYKVTGGGGAARKRSAFSVWSFEDIETKLGLLESNGGAAKMATEHVHDLRARLLESIQVVLVDPAEIAGHGDMSAKLLELLYAPLLALVDDLRECWGKHLESLQSGLLRFLLAHGERNADEVFVPGLADCVPILKRFSVEKQSGGKRWLTPPCSLLWGDYFSPSNQDIKDAVVIAKSARGEKAGGDGSGADAAGDPLITRKTAMRFVAPYFGVDDLDAESEELDGEIEEKESKQLEKEERENAALHDLAAAKFDAKSKADRAAGRGKPPKSAGGGGGSKAGAKKA
jgi:hypothetical protein